MQLHLWKLSHLDEKKTDKKKKEGKNEETKQISESSYVPQKCLVGV